MILMDNVSKSYKTKGGRKIILNNQTFVFTRGYSYAILGVNGAGKSTLVKILFGALQPDSGTIQWRGTRQTIASTTKGLTRNTITR